jgi:hypothetical protein
MAGGPTRISDRKDEFSSVVIASYGVLGFSFFYRGRRLPLTKAKLMTGLKRAVIFDQTIRIMPMGLRYRLTRLSNPFNRLIFTGHLLLQSVLMNFDDDIR